jgi:exodeoxyribonuclease V alpha subunit
VIDSASLPVVHLTEIFRQAAQSRIITTAHRINRGAMPDLTPEEGSDFYFVEANEPEDAVRKLLTIVSDRLPKRFGLNPISDVQVLCPMNRGGLGARSLNLEIQKILNPPGDQKIERFGWSFGPGDKIMQVENNYEREVFNGDLGIVDPSIRRMGSSRPSSTAARSPIRSESSTRSFSPTPSPFTNHKARNTPLWSSRFRRSTT